MFLAQKITNLYLYRQETTPSDLPDLLSLSFV